MTTTGRKRSLLVNADKRRVDQYTQQIRPTVYRWLLQMQDEMVKEITTAPSFQLSKALLSDADIINLLATFGIRQITNSGKPLTSALGGSWKIPPSLFDSVIRDKAVKIKNLRADIREAVRETVRNILQAANREIPQPSTGTIARRIRTTLADMHAFSIGRSALIARTEAKQNISTGIVHGMKIAGVKEIEWISSRNPAHGDRHHERMHGMKIKLGEKFTNPTTKRKLRYPGDPLADISETANCGCTVGMVRIK